jgi:hypothetical protein
MSETAQVALAVLCFSVAGLAQVIGLVLLILEARRTSSALRRWRGTEPQLQERDTLVKVGEVDGLVAHLLGNQFDRTAALVLLLIGFAAGALGNLLAL